MSADTSKLDSLIEDLEGAIESTNNIDFTASADINPKSATFKINSVSFGSVSERNKPRQASVVKIVEGIATMQTRDNIIKACELDITIFFEKNRIGEILYHSTGEVISSEKISGGYLLEVEFKTLDKVTIPAFRRLIEYASSGDFASWNRWCASLKEGAMLQDIDLSNMNLKHFDFCCANLEGSDFHNSDLSYSNLSGANLEGCNLDNVRITGADLYMVRLPRKYMAYLSSSGIIEVESVKLV